MIQVATCSPGVTHDGFKEIRALLFLLARDWPVGGGSRDTVQPMRLREKSAQGIMGKSCL